MIATIFARSLCALLLFVSLYPANGYAIEHPESDLKGVGIRTELGKMVDLTLPFTDSTGTTKPLGEFAGGRPFIIVPAYYHCPRLCGLVLQGVVDLVNKLDLKFGSDYRVLTISFDPSDGPADAKSQQDDLSTRITNPKRREVAPTAWQFLTGSEQHVRTVMNQIGFYYKEDKGEFAHGAAIMVLTPAGKISQYFTGIEYRPFDLRLALVSAGGGQIGSIVDHVFLYCFRYDALKGKYVWAAYGAMRIGGVLTLLLLGGLIIRLMRRERKAEAA